MGAIGGYVAAALAEAEPEIDIDAIATRPIEELRVDTRDDSWVVKMAMLDSPGQVTSPRDWVLLATKAHQIEAVGPWLDALVGPQSVVVVLQNGIRHAQRVSRWAPPERVVPVVAWLGVHREAPGHVVARSTARLAVAETPAGRDFSALANGPRLEVEVIEHFDHEMWRKLCLNVSGGAIAAAAARPIAQITDDRLAEIARGLMGECVAVAAAEGVTLDGDDYEPMLDWIIDRRGKGMPSPLQDRLAGRPIEVQARNGAIVEVGRQRGVETPWNSAMLDVLAGAHDHQDDLLNDVVQSARDLGAR